MLVSCGFLDSGYHRTSYKRCNLCVGRTLLLLWGVNKFTKKLRDPELTSTNEIDNLLQRVPDFELVESARPLDT